MGDGDIQAVDTPIWLVRGSDIYDLIKPAASSKTVSAGQVLIAQGGTVSHIYFVLKGCAHAFCYTEDGQKFWVADFASGDLFGHSEVLSDAKVEFEILADSNMQLAVLPAKVFSDMLQEVPLFGKSVSIELAANLRGAQMRLFELATLSAAARIYAELLRMAKPIGEAPDTKIIRPHPIYSNFALRVHSSRETVSRTINTLKKKGIVERKTGALVILKPESLRTSK